MDELDTWLETSIGAEPLRAEVRQACGGSLEDLRSCELEDLESELPLSSWPPLERQRFLRAWRELRGENDVDEAAADDASADDAAADDAGADDAGADDAGADTDEEPAAAPRPPSPVPAPASPPPPALPAPAEGPRYQVGDQVEARWKGGERYYPALVLVARVDGSVDLRYTDDDTESRVHPSLLRPLSRRRGRARRAPTPAPVAESSDAESEPAAPLTEAASPMAEDEPVAPESEPVPAPPAPVPAPPTPEPTPELDVKAGKERSRREQSEMDRALEAGRAAARAAAAAVDAAEGSAVEATSNASEAVAADREDAGDRAVAAAAGARSHAAGSCRTATATAVDALDKADALPAPVATKPEPTEPPPISTPAVELAPPAAARAPSPEPVAPDEPAPMDTTQSPAHDAPAAAASAMDVDATETASVLDRLRADMVRTVDIASRHNRPPNVDWRIGHTYSFLGAMHALGADTRATLAEALIRGRRGEIEPSTARRAVARILDGNLRTLERFQHTLRQISAPIASAATVSWYDPASGVDLYAYATCGAAAKEWGVRDVDIRGCVEGNVDTVNGLHFRRQARWPVPPGAERVSEGVYRVGDDRYRVQLGHDWGFLGNFDSAGAAALVHAGGWERLRHARRSLEAHTLRQLTEGATVDLSGCYVLLRRIASGTSFPSAFAVRKHRVPFAPFDGPHDAYFVSRRRGREIPYGTELLNAHVQRLERELTWWDPRDRSRGLCAQRLVARDGNQQYHGYQYQLVRRDGDAAAVDGADASLVQLWRRTAVPAPVAPAPAVPPPPADWAQCATCDKWRVLPADVSAASLSDHWKCGDIGVSCSKVACSLEDADCACHRRGWDGEVVLLSSTGAITATYCSPAGAAAAHGITWQDAQRRCASKALTKPKIESATPPILRYATAWDGEIKRREAAKAAAEKRRVAQQAAAARSKDTAEAAAAAEAAMAALRKPAEWAQCSRCERWRLLPESASAASDAWTCADVGVPCEKTQCAAENPECECHASGFSLDREVVSVSPEGRIVETYCSAQGAGAALGMARSRVAECLNTKQVSKVNNVLRYAKDWAEEVQSRKTEARPRVTCTLCRKARVVPPGITIDDEEDWKCDDAPENWFAGASNTIMRRQRLSCETRECSTGMPYCPCQSNVGRGVDQTRDDGVIVRHCSIAACARALYPDAPDAELWKSNVVSAVEKGKPYAYDKDNDVKGGAFKGSKFSWARQDCAYCASGARPETILLCDGWNCANEAHYHCAGLDAIPSGRWFCCDACEQNPAPVARRAPNGDGTRTTRCGECEGCRAEECGSCKFCLDRPSRGGKNTLRKPCVLRQCETVLSNYGDTRRRWGSGGGASANRDTPREEEKEDSPGPGTRVWALFDDDSLPQSWWGGTIISISGVAEEMRYEVVFDDGERQGVYAAHVFHSPPDEQLPVSGPNAKAKALLEKALPKPKPKPKPPAQRKRPAPKRPAEPPRPQMPTGNCPVCYEPFSDDVKSFNCGHHLCGTCSEALARHKAEQGVNTTRQGVQVSCPLCRKRARVGLSES